MRTRSCGSATAALIGGLAFWLLTFTDLPQTPRLLLTTGLTFGLRLFAMRRRLQLPKVQRLPDSPSSIAKQRDK